MGKPDLMNDPVRRNRFVALIVQGQSPMAAAHIAYGYKQAPRIADLLIHDPAVIAQIIACYEVV